jgi:Ca-activated chloride channel family protein
VALVLLLGAGGLGAGFVYINRKSCTGQVTASITAAGTISPILQRLSKQWSDTKPSVAGTCVSVSVVAKDSAVMAQALGTNWDEAANGPLPDVWVPESTAWVRRASSAAIAERMMPDLQPSLARSPAVIAMPKPMAEALGWPKVQVSWQDVITKYAATPGEWGKLGKPWGDFRFGMTDPLKSTAGLLALMAIQDVDDDGEVTDAELAGVLKLKQVRAVYLPGTEQIFKDLATADAQGQDAALRYLSAFPAIEQDVLAYNQTSPKVPLAAIYPSNGSGDADYPYLILNGPTANRQHQDAAHAFLSYARGTGRQTFMAAGFRDPNRVGGKGLTETNGFSAKVATLPRAVLLPESVQQTMDTWTALTRPTNVLIVLDVSGSMKAVVPGTGKTRLQLAKDAATGAVSLFGGDTFAGLWEFSTKLDGAKGYKSVVPLGKLSDEIGGKSRKEAMLTAIDKLQPTGDTALYDTVAAAQQTVLENYKPGSTNLVVLMTDGKNDNPAGGLTLDQLNQRLNQTAADATKKVPVVTVAYGEDADAATLQEISRVTGALSYTSKTSFDIEQVLLTAIFGRV